MMRAANVRPPPQARRGGMATQRKPAALDAQVVPDRAGRWFWSYVGAWRTRAGRRVTGRICSGETFATPAQATAALRVRLGQPTLDAAVMSTTPLELATPAPNLSGARILP